nr:EOG090X0CJA [Lepidurus arcticus]
MTATDEPNAEASEQDGGDTNSPPPNGQRSTLSKITHFSSSYRVESLLWLTRILTIFFSLSYFIFPFGNPVNIYYKALVSNCATSALRLHQRVPRVSISREFLSTVLLEDSAHYLLFSLIFMYNAPVSLAIVPILLFAVLHTSSFTLKFLDIISSSSLGLLRTAIGFVELQAVFIFRSIAFGEIFLLPTCVLLVFSGRFSIFSVFLYYRFLVLRYSSRRNPYTRVAFSELRMQTEFIANHPRCPAVAAQMLRTLIGTALRFAPNIPPN